MEISILLGKTILSMLLACFVGFAAVRVGILKSEESKVVSKIVAYICSPCAIVNAFLVEITEERVTGLMIAFIAAILWNVVVIGMVRIIGGLGKYDAIERVSIIYTNAGYLVIPVVYTVLGSEWVLYTSAFCVVQTILYWSHCVTILRDEKHVEWKKVLINPNFIAIYVGAIMFAFGLEFPIIIQTTVSDFGGMIGTISIFVIGMLIGSQDLKKLFTKKRVYVICLWRLIMIPVVTVFIFVGVSMVVTHPDLHNILLIVLWAACAPVGTMITQLSQLYGLESEYASQINLMSVLCCVITMPLITYMYEGLTALL